MQVLLPRHAAKVWSGAGAPEGALLFRAHAKRRTVSAIPDAISTTPSAKTNNAGIDCYDHTSHVYIRIAFKTM